MRHVEIDWTKPRLTVDGVDITSMVTAVQVNMGATERYPTVTLALRSAPPEDAVDRFDAIVQAAAPGMSASEFLGIIDAQALAKEVLERVGWEDDPVETAVIVLREMAERLT